MYSIRLDTEGSAADILRSLSAATHHRNLPPPAALVGQWFGAAAVIAPSVHITPTNPAEVFDATPGECQDIIGGGWIGYLSYPDTTTPGARSRIPHAAGGWTDCVLRLDQSGCWWYDSLTNTKLPRWIAEACHNLAEPKPCEILWEKTDFEARRAQHHDAVLSCLAAISAGDLYQACICTQFHGFTTGSPLDFFAHSLTNTTPARAAYLAGPWGAVASLSPELFLRRVGNTVSSSPIKGTLPLSADPAQLRASIKDVAENIMIVDLVRNDLGRIATTGTVNVVELLNVHPAPGVWHLVSTVAAQLATDLPTAALLEATFPPASVTGTPKIIAQQLLSQWEKFSRGVYCGTIGLASPLAGTELNVAIRTLEFDPHGNTVLGVGGGITADSTPEAEWQECLHKAAPIMGSHIQQQLRYLSAMTGT